MEVHSEADSHLQPREDLMLEERNMPKGRFDLVKSPHWNRPLAGPVALGRGAHADAVHEELQPMGGTNTGEVHEQL
ncbi:ubx domain-containing protein 4 [Willisornis vidua]|uniref:Ubx domain-containing protein 4 n=1 Tax=Willisornis vidua TaxID=1566151 RepID=A0ABQ9CXN4_9PASS|nr:ubx domain-containing protein 4 [Willisornis vidua]